MIYQLYLNDGNKDIGPGKGPIKKYMRFLHGTLTKCDQMAWLFFQNLAI